MDLSKIEMVFDPASVKGRIHIIGCGSVGSTVAELLARYGLTKFTLWDMDFVEPKNIVNQMFFQQDIAHPKVEAVGNILCNVNPDIKEDLVLMPNGWQGETVKGYVFLAVDSIEIRKQFLEKKPAFQCIFDNLNLINPRIQNSAWSELATTWKNYMEVIMNQGGDVNSNSEDMVTEIDEILADHA